MRLCMSAILFASAGSLWAQSLTTPWSGYGHDPQHTGVSANAA
jgi:hypothetical protein